MHALAKKVATARRVLRQQGVAGVMSVLQEKVRPIVGPPADYARLAPSAAAVLLRHGRPDLLVNAIGAGIGDDLLLTAMFRELRRRGRDRFWVTNRYAELYRGNPDVPFVLPPLSRYDILLKRLGVRVVYPWYTSYNPACDRDEPVPQEHIISVMCQKAGITGRITMRPYLHLTADERQRGRLVRQQVAIQSSGLAARHPMRNKNWPLERYQSVVAARRDRYDFVQVGSLDDPPLDGVLDLRGRTTLRETAAVLAGSLAFVGQVGFLMHLARAVDRRSVIVYGGRETPAQSGYPCNENLVAAVPCAPCWRLNACPYDRTCLQLIRPAAVIDALDVQVARYGTPLACDEDIITPARIERTIERFEAAVAAHKQAWLLLYQ